MNVNTLITVISILVAVYALVPRATRLTLSLKMHCPEWLFVVLVLIALHYLLFYEFFERVGWVPKFHLRELLTNRDEASYFLVVLSLILLSIRFRFFSFPRAKLSHLHELVEELVAAQGSHAQLISLLSANLPKLGRICGGRGPLRRLRKAACKEKYDVRVIVRRTEELGKLPESNPRFKFPIMQRSNFEFLKYLVGRVMRREEGAASVFPLLQERNIATLRGGIRGMLSVPMRWLPESEEESIQACEILELGLGNRGFVASVAALRPYFGLDVLEQDLSVSHDFSDLYLSLLMQNPTSVLYSELNNNQNLGAQDDYLIPVRNRLLGYLFHDAKIAEKLGVWRPVGEAIISELERRRLAPGDDNYNFPMHDFQERGCWESEVYVGIRFFDLMVRKAIVQNITWHMWLYYFSHITEKICANFKSTHIDPDSIEEWPSRYGYLLYEIVSKLRAWIMMIRRLSLNQENLRLDQEDNGNPVKSSIIVLGYCLYEIANCSEIPDRFKRYLIEIALHLYFKLRKTVKTEAYAKYMFATLARGGNWDRANPKYLGTLLQTLVFQDNVPYDCDTVVESMERIGSKYQEKWGLSSLADYVEYEQRNGEVVLKSPKRDYTIKL